MATVTPKNRGPLPYVPEQDDGWGARGRAILSADMWIPIEFIRDPEAVLAAAIVRTVDKRTGETQTLRLARRTRYHLVMSRHLHRDWSAKLDHWDTVDLAAHWDDVDFGDRIDLRNDEQRAAWRELAPAANGVLNLGCGKGKTVLALKKIAARRAPALVVVNNEGLIKQWIERAKAFLTIDDDQIGVVQGAKAQWDRPLVIAMIHTLASRADQIPVEVRARFGTIVFDEVHHLSATTFLRTAPLFFGNRYGLTATAQREDGLESAYYAQVGDIFHTDLVGDLTASIYFAKTSLELADNAKEMTDRTGEFSAGKLYTYLAENSVRNTLLCQMVEDALAHGRKILVLTHSANHPETLKNLFDGRNAGKGLTSAAISGKTHGAARTQLIEHAHVSFATFQVAREGLDVAALDTVIFATPFKAWGGLQQGKGRIERNVPGKQDPLVVVLDDVGIGPCRAMCRSLRSSIRAHGFTYVDLR